MASPQKENGYTAISNEILEALAHSNLCGSEFQIIITLLRKSYGFRKKGDRISLSQFCLYTGKKRSRVCELLKKLESRKMITRLRNGRITYVEFNKNYEDWKLSVITYSYVKADYNSPPQRTKLVPPCGHTKETNKRNFTKESARARKNNSSYKEKEKNRKSLLNPDGSWDLNDTNLKL